eukprot:Rmarinus@m.27483
MVPGDAMDPHMLQCEEMVVPCAEQSLKIVQARTPETPVDDVEDVVGCANTCRWKGRRADLSSHHAECVSHYACLLLVRSSVRLHSLEQQYRELQCEHRALKQAFDTLQRQRAQPPQDAQSSTSTTKNRGGVSCSASTLDTRANTGTSATVLEPPQHQSSHRIATTRTVGHITPDPPTASPEATPTSAATATTGASGQSRRQLKPLARSQNISGPHRQQPAQTSAPLRREEAQQTPRHQHYRCVGQRQQPGGIPEKQQPQAEVKAEGSQDQDELHSER